MGQTYTNFLHFANSFSVSTPSTNEEPYAPVTNAPNAANNDSPAIDDPDPITAFSSKLDALHNALILLLPPHSTSTFRTPANDDCDINDRNSEVSPADDDAALTLPSLSTLHDLSNELKHLLNSSRASPPPNTDNKAAPTNETLSSDRDNSITDKRGDNDHDDNDRSTKNIDTDDRSNTASDKEDRGPYNRNTNNTNDACDNQDHDNNARENSDHGHVDHSIADYAPDDADRQLRSQQPPSKIGSTPLCNTKVDEFYHEHILFMKDLYPDLLPTTSPMRHDDTCINEREPNLAFLSTLDALSNELLHLLHSSSADIDDHSNAGRENDDRANANSSQKDSNKNERDKNDCDDDDRGIADCSRDNNARGNRDNNDERNDIDHGMTDYNNDDRSNVDSERADCTNDDDDDRKIHECDIDKLPTNSSAGLRRLRHSVRELEKVNIQFASFVEFNYTPAPCQPTLCTIDNNLPHPQPCLELQRNTSLQYVPTMAPPPAPNPARSFQNPTQQPSQTDRCPSSTIGTMFLVEHPAPKLIPCDLS